MNGKDQANIIKGKLVDLMIDTPLDKNALEWWELIKHLRAGLDDLESKIHNIVSESTKELGKNLSEKSS